MPDTIEDIAIGEDSNIDVGYENVVESALLLVSKKRVGHPYFPRVRHGEVLDLGCKNKIYSDVKQ